jgi:hypothetical protein
MKVNIKDFTWLPTDVSKVSTKWGHSKLLRAKGHIANRLREKILEIDQQSRDALGSLSS